MNKGRENIQNQDIFENIQMTKQKQYQENSSQKLVDQFQMNLNESQSQIEPPNFARQPNIFGESQHQQDLKSAQKIETQSRKNDDDMISQTISVYRQGLMKDDNMHGEIDHGNYFGRSLASSMSDKDRKSRFMGGKNQSRGLNIEDQFNKKQIEFKEGVLHQMISDQSQNSNQIITYRYGGKFGAFYFLVDTLLNFENLLLILLFIVVNFSKGYNKIDISFPTIALIVNFLLISIKNIILELRQRKVCDLINKKQVEYLMITRKNKRFVPISWQDVKPGYIIKVKNDEEFPADCLILDIQGHSGQKCYVSAGPFELSTGVVQKKSFDGTQNKTGSQQNDQQIAEMISGFLKYEYNYYGFIQGAFKLNDSPAAVEFNKNNVVKRGQILTQSTQVIGLVLNIGDQCMGSIFKTIQQSDNKNPGNSFKKQRDFDKAYKENIKYILVMCIIKFSVFTALSIYLSSQSKIIASEHFEIQVMDIDDDNHHVQQALGFFSVLLSSIPFSFTNIIDLLVLIHTIFAEWDINMIPARIQFLFPHATLAFGKVAHLFFSRLAIQRDDSQSVKVFHVGGHFFLNQESKVNQDLKMNQDFNIDIPNQFDDDDDLNENTLEYLPNELKLKNKFNNEIADMILAGPQNQNKEMIIEFFRGINLCHQANVIKENNDPENIKYMCVLNDEIASLEFTKQYDYKLVQRSKKTITIMMQGQQERYDELGVVTTNAVMGHTLTISAIKLQGSEAGLLYMKGSIASLKNYFVNSENDFQYLNLFEQKFIISGIQAIVYAKRKLTVDETNNLIITINEGSSKSIENVQLEKLLQSLTSAQLEILGVLGVQKPIHLRNRVVIDEMIMNGVKPWIISKEDEQTHLTCLNSLKLFNNCLQPLIINGSREKTVMDQIQNALKIIIERMSQDQGQKNNQEENFSVAQSQSNNNYKQSSKRYNSAQIRKEEINEINQNERNEEQNIGKKENQRNVVIFTGNALKEILRDQTMQKSFLTLAYVSDILIGSEISPMQKQKLIKIVKSYIGKGEYTASIISTVEDQFMASEADIVANFKNKIKSDDFQAISDVTFQDFSAISYLLFKHGNQIQMRLSKASQAFIYRYSIQFLVLSTYMIESGFNGSIPYTQYFYYVFILFLAPAQILAYSTFYKDFAYDYLYRIDGHYKYNFSFNLVEFEHVIIDIISALYDWAIIFLPQELFYYGNPISLNQGKNTSQNAYSCYQVVLMNFTFLLYLMNTNVIVLYSLNILIFLFIIGLAMIFDDDGLVGTQQLISSPTLMLSLLFQILMLMLKNCVVNVFSQLVFNKYHDLYKWYQIVEERLTIEEYEDPKHTFSIKNYQPLFQKINASTIHNTLKLINLNMMKCPKSDFLENILDKINIELDNDMRGGQQSSMSGMINRYTLELNDLNKETEYQEVKNGRETVYVQRAIIVFICTTVIFAVLGILLTIILGYTNIGIYYYVALCILSIIIYYLLPSMAVYASNIILFYTTVVVFCYTIYSSQGRSLQPTGLIFVLAFVAGLNHSFVYITIFIILISDIMNIFFSSISESQSQDNQQFQQIQSSFIKLFSGILWSVYVYAQELDKKTEYVNGNRKVRNYLKLKSILNILVPSLVRDKIQSGKKNFSEDEGEVTIVFIDLYQFDDIVKIYSGIELIQFLDKIYNAFDQLCDQYGLEKIETVGKTYMACGGLKASEKKIDARVLNRHHSVRVTDFAVEAQKYSKQVLKKNGKYLELKIGVHTGTVISGVVGETKPQFSLIGDTVNKTSRVCSLTAPNKVSVSKEAHKYLEIYTNNYNFSQTFVEMKGIGREPIYSIQTFKVLRSKSKIQATQKNRKKSFTNEKQTKDKEKNDENLKQSQQINGQKNFNEERRNSFQGSQYDMQSESSQTHTVQISQRKFLEQNEMENQMEDQMDATSDKSDQIDENTMNVFGFNDDINIDDRVIVKNPTENQVYNLVERPKYLLSFELKDAEQEFIYTISFKEAKQSMVYLLLLIVLIKIIIVSDTFMTSLFIPSIQFYIMFPLLLFEILITYKIYNPQFEKIYLWNFSLLLYGMIVLLILLSFQVQAINDWNTFANIEFQIEFVFQILFMMRNILLKQYLVFYISWLIIWVFTVALISKQFQYQIIQILIGQVMYLILLTIGIHHREMIQRKSLNYERVLNIQIEQTNTLISKLVPYHILNFIKNEKKHVDEFEDVTLLFTDMVGFTAFSKNVQDPKEVVQLLSKLFSRFDHLCEEQRVYKVHTIGDCYVIMGYNGRIDKNKRMRAIVSDEANRVVKCGLQMIEIIQEIRDDSLESNLKDLDMRIGIHTGKFVAGIIGSKVVRYDIFGEGVLIANKMESNGIPGRVCITEDTMKVLMNVPDIYNEYVYEQHLSFKCSSIEKEINTFAISKRAKDSFRSNLSSSKYNESISDSDSSSSKDQSSFVQNKDFQIQKRKNSFNDNQKNIFKN